MELSTLMDKLQSQNYDRVEENFARQLDSAKQKLSEAVKRLSKFQRTAATHIMVFMISPES